MIIINGREKAKDFLETLKRDVASLSFVPVFCDILVGQDKASIQYVNLKKKKALELGIDFYDAVFEDTINTEELLREINKINKIPNMCGVIVQLPLPEDIDTKKILDAIDQELDVDCLGQISSGIFYGGDEKLVPPTALSCMYLLESLNLDLKTKKILVLGQGKLVGKPVSQLLKNRGLSFEVLDSKNENKLELIKNADIIISGIGQGKFINGNMVKDGVVIVDAGTSEEGGSLVGDVDFDSVAKKASFITPVPGGVGPMTVAMLFRNVLQVAKIKNESNK